jgi:hypothetical protein
MTRPPTEAAPTAFIAGVSIRSPAANAPATTVTARTDPTAGTAAGTGISVTGRQCDDWGCVLEPKDAGGSPLALCAGLQGHGSQHERCCGQSQCKFSHQTLLLFPRLRRFLLLKRYNPTRNEWPSTATPMHGRVIKSPCGEFRSAAECSILHRLALAGHRRIKARKGGSHPHGGEVSWIAENFIADRQADFQNSLESAWTPRPAPSCGRSRASTAKC